MNQRGKLIHRWHTPLPSHMSHEIFQQVQVHAAHEICRDVRMTCHNCNRMCVPQNSVHALPVLREMDCAAPPTHDQGVAQT